MVLWLGVGALALWALMAYGPTRLPHNLPLQLVNDGGMLSLALAVSGIGAILMLVLGGVTGRLLKRTCERFLGHEDRPTRELWEALYEKRP